MSRFTAELITVLVLVGSLYDHFRDIPWENVFKLSASAATISKFCGWAQVGMDVSIPCDVQLM